ncbi:MAG TPA: class I SAM-dependent methyltransferase [Chitinophagales bacterium]|nr:class I SAM-dependent methyltransferase [Chitinophagales bacterium]
MDKNKFIPALGYDWLSGLYDLTIKLTMPEERFRNKLIEYLNPQSNEIILEFGFGTAQNLILGKNKNQATNFIGVDIDPKIKSIAAKKLNKIGFDIPLFLYDGNTLPFPDNHFDKVFSSLVFHQLDKDAKLHCLKELQRVLKPNGELLIGDWGKAKSTLMRIVFYFVQLLDGFKTTNDNVSGLMPWYISEAGFLQVKEVDFINTKIGTYSYYKAIK